MTLSYTTLDFPTLTEMELMDTTSHNSYCFILNDLVMTRCYKCLTILHTIILCATIRLCQH